MFIDIFFRQALGWMGILMVNSAMIAAADELNCDQFMDRLKNANDEPRIVGESPHQMPYFDRDYNWEEQDRIVATMKSILKDFDNLWPCLIDRFDDESYCLTINYGQSVDNASLGDVAEELLRQQFVAAYLPCLEGYEFATRKLRNFGVIRTDEFINWCRERIKKQKSLYEIQIELCDWAIDRIRGFDNEVLGERDRLTSIEKIIQQRDRIREIKKPVLTKSFFVKDARTLFSRKNAERLRCRIDAKDE